MIIIDFKIAARNILRNKVQAAISILGLGIGLGSIILLMALIVHENSFDRFIPEYHNVYKVNYGKSLQTPSPLAEAMKMDFPEVKGFFRYNMANNIQVRNLKNEAASNQNFAFADTSIYRIEGVKLIAGTPAVSSSEVAISKKTALKFFGNTIPIGEVLRAKLNDKFLTLTVSGIFNDFPSNSTLYPDYVVNIKLAEVMFGQFTNSLGQYGKGFSVALGWDLPVFYTYVVLDKNTDKSNLTSKMQKYTELLSRVKSKDLKYSLQPICDIYLKSDGYDETFRFFREGNANELKYYWAISFLILLISITNYIFLARAATSNRLHELGTRKVLGASRNILRKQIVLESILVTILSLIPATMVIDLGMTFINNTMNRTLTNAVFANPIMWPILITVVVFTGTISGILIGFKISRTSPLLLLSGKKSEKNWSHKWDYSFLIFHFSLYIILVVSVISVTKQIKYAEVNLKGINPRNILVCQLNSPGLQASFTTLCSEIEKIPGVLKVAGSSFIPPFDDFLPITLATPEGKRERFDGLIIGEGITEMLGIEIKEGSSFGPFQTSTVAVLINETCAAKFNAKTGDNFFGVNVRGIVRDFHAHTFHTMIQPLVILQQNPANMGQLAIKTDMSNDKAVISKLRELYNQIAPDEIFEVKYLTTNINDFYTAEKNEARIMGAFSLLATVLAMMGLFGIALISITRKTKEIGLRKVNGAAISEVIYLLNKDFIKWVFISLLIGIPVASYLMSVWQNRFAYKTDISWWIFAVAGISAILVAVLTVSWLSWRAATRNPVEALRYE